MCETLYSILADTSQPAFGPLAIKDMYEEMLDISTQLVAKWARIGPDQEIDVTGDMTRLTLDSIALWSVVFDRGKVNH